MPQGKGTYGSQVGRPPKKDKYKYGGNVDPFSARNEEGIGMEKAKELVEQKNMQEKFTENMGIPISNAQDRTQSMPDTEKYDKGGKIEELPAPGGNKSKKDDLEKIDYMEIINDRLAKTPPKKSKNLAAPPKNKRPRPPKNSMKSQGKKGKNK
mgnify:CR=1 FL=1